MSSEASDLMGRLEGRLNALHKAIQETDAECERLGRERLILQGQLIEVQRLYEDLRRPPAPQSDARGNIINFACKRSGDTAP